MRVKSMCLFLLFSLLFCNGCGAVHTQESTPLSVLQEICAEERPLPDGRFYAFGDTRAAEELSLGLLTLLFGNGVTPPALDGVSDAAIYLSFKHPCEFALFFCKGLRETEEVSQMCLARIAALRAEWVREGSSEEVAAYLNSATVRVRGRWVLLCISSDPENALRAFRRLV